ncbi:MAG: Rha family transcriptional regulator [Rhizobium sp.]|nr:Rha family transcriptional regulator [Rhizobium sp.]
MNLVISAPPVTMSSREIADLLDKRHDSVKRTIERLAETSVVRFTPSVETSHEGAGSRPIEVLRVSERDSYVVVAQLSPEFTARLVDYWQEHKTQRPQIPTTAEAFAQAFTMLADAERRQKEQDVRLSLIDERIDKVETAQIVLSSRPAASESIVHVRKRIGKEYGLSVAVVDAVMRQSPYAPRPAGTVRNENANADGATYVVFWKKDVTATFDRFVGECRHSAGKLYTHPFVRGRFKLAPEMKSAI